MIPMTHDWPGDRAILLVHGIGDAGPDDYTKLVEAVEAALGARAGEFALYELYYNFINNWFKDKTSLAAQLQQAKALFKIGVNDPELAETIAEYAGDVLWPVLSRSARAAVREAYLLQLKQVVRDGIDAGIDPVHQKITIIAHSLGCFYTYEVLHAAATRPSHTLQPYTDGVRFDNVILMAPPIQLIRRVGEALGPVIPNRNELAACADEGLSLPGQLRRGKTTLSARNWVSMTGELDPVGGYFFRRRAAWAYTDIAGQVSIVDPQTAVTGIASKADLVSVLQGSLSDRKKPTLTIDNPHSWLGYVARHEQELQQWLAV